LLTLFVFNLSLALLSPRWFMLISIIFGNFPFTWLQQSGGFLSSFGGLHPSGIIELSVVAGTFLIVAMNLRTSIPFLAKGSLYIYFICFGSLSLLWTDHTVFGFRMLTKLAAPFLFFITCAISVRTPHDIKLFEKAIFMSAIISITLAFSNYIFGYAQQFIFQGRTYLTVPGVSPAPFSFHMSIATLLSLASYMNQNKKRYLIFGLIFGSGVFLAFTRISMAGLIISSSLLVFILAKSKIAKIIIPSILTFSFILSLFFIPTMKARMFQNPEALTLDKAQEKPSALLSQIHGSGRFRAWEIALEKFFLPNPAVGAGIGSTQAWFYEKSKLGRGVLHSEYLRIICELGILGFCLFIVGLCGFVWIIVNAFLKLDINYRSKYPSLAFSCLIFYLITLTTDNSFDYIRGFGNYVFGIIAITSIVSISNLEPENEKGIFGKSI